MEILNRLSVDERLEWLKNHYPNMEVGMLRDDLYSYAFNHPYYCGDTNRNSDDVRHEILDDFLVPRLEKTKIINE